MSEVVAAAWPELTAWVAGPARPKVVLVDIDGTLTHATPGVARPLASNPLVACLLQRGVPLVEATERMRQAEAKAGASVMVGRAWPFGADLELGLAPGELAQAIVSTFTQRYTMAPDAARFMQGLRTLPGLRVYPATTNPSLYILGKLAAGKLADATGTPYFDELFGGEEVSLGGKCGPGFYQAIAQRVGVPLSECLMIGDEVPADLDYAQAAGLSRVVIVNRQQPAPFQAGPRGSYFVDSLDLVLAALRHAK